VDVELAPLVVLLGPNAAGKSNFLEALLLLSRLGTERTLADAFAGAIRGYPLEAFTLPDGGLAELLKTPSTSLAIEADIRLAGAPKEAARLRYRVAVRLEPATGALSVADELLTRRRADGAPLSGFLPRIEAVDLGAPETERSRGMRLAIRRHGKQGHPSYEELGLGHTVLSNLQYGGEARYPDFDRLRTELMGWRIHYLDPRVAMRVAQPPRDVTDIGEHGELIAPFLYRLKNDESRRRSFQAIGRTLRSVVPLDSLDVDLDPKRGTLDIQIVQHGTPYSSRVISEGTLRLLALCGLAANPWPRSLLAFEEPENGVHPKRIETIARLVARMVSGAERRQVVVTTHSPDFAVEVHKLVRSGELGKAQVRFLQARQEGRYTRLAPLNMELPLLVQPEFDQALADPEEEGILRQLFVRGWTNE